MTRLPISGQDIGTWGKILNDFLLTEHNPDGTLRLRNEGVLEAKEDVAHKSTDGALGNSDVLYPSQKAVKTAISNSVAGTIPLSYIDTDDTLAANSDSRIASQRAIKAAIDLMQYKVSIVVGKRGTPGFRTDGVDDGVQINAAKDFIKAMSSTGYGIIEMPDEHYYIGANNGGGVQLDNGIYFKGAGIFQTTLHGTADLGNNAVMLGNATLGSPLTDCVISDLKIDGTAMSRATNSTFRKGIDVLYTLRMRVFNVHIYKTPATGFGPDCNVELLIDNCIFDSCGTAGQNPGYNGLGIGTGYYQNESCLVTNCTAIGGLNNGFLLEYVGGGFNSKDYQFSNCYAINNRRGFRVSGCSGATFENCKSINSGSENFYIHMFGAALAYPTGVKIIGCDSYGAGADGIYFKDQEAQQANHIISNCHSYSNAGYGLVCGASNTRVSGNTIYNNAKTGIFYHAYSASPITHVQITNNLCYNNGQAGVAGAADGIRVHGELGAIDGVQILGNACFDTQTTKTQAYGITVKGQITNVLVRDNDTRNNLTAGILDAPNTPTPTNIYLNNKGFNPDELYSQGTVSGAVTFNQTNGSTITALLAGNITAVIPAGKSINSTLTLILSQDSSGARTVSWPANVKLASGGLTLSTAPNAVDVIKLLYDGTQWREISRAMAANTVSASATALVDSNGAIALSTSATANAINSFTVTNGATGAAPQLSSTGSDTNIGIFYVSKGTGRHIFRPGTNATNAFSVQNAAGTVSALNVDTSNTRVGINQGVPTSSLHINGSIATAFTLKTASYTATTTDSTIACDTTSSSLTITLPSSVGITGRTYTIKRVDGSANTLTVITSLSQTIDGSSNYILGAQYKYVTVQSDGANWMIIGNN